MTDASSPPLLARCDHLRGGLGRGPSASVEPTSERTTSVTSTRAIVFESGRLGLTGHADFLAEPHAGVQALAVLSDKAFDDWTPVAERYTRRVIVGDAVGPWRAGIRAQGEGRPPGRARGRRSPRRLCAHRRDDA